MNREPADDGSGRYLRLAVPGLAGHVLPARRAAAALAGVLRGAVRHGRKQRDLLPAAAAGDLRRLAGPGRRRFRDDRQGQPLPHPRAAAARPGRTGAPAARRGRRARRPARSRAAAVAAGPAGRPAAARRVPGPVPGRDPGGGRAQARVVVVRRGAGRPGGQERRPLLGGPERGRGHAAVAHGRLGVPAVPPGRRRRRLAALPRGHAARLGGPDRRDLGRGPGRVRLLQQRPARRRAPRRGGLRRGRRRRGSPVSRGGVRGRGRDTRPVRYLFCR